MFCQNLVFDENKINNIKMILKIRKWLYRLILTNVNILPIVVFLMET